MNDRAQAEPRIPTLAGVLTLTAFGTALHAMLAFSSAALPGRELVEADSYTRMLRVLQLWHGGGWYDGLVPQINGPQGLDLHWTRLLDLLILLPAWPAILVGVAPDVAFYWSGALVCPALHLLACLAAVWAARPLWPPSWCWFAGAMLLLAGAPLGYSLFGRADHHTLILLSGVVGIGYALRAARSEPGAAFRAGLAFGAGVWVSTETLILAMPTIAGFGLHWLAGRPAAAKAGGRIALGMATAICLVLPVERPWGRMLVVDQDRISVQHVVLALTVATVFAVVGRLPRRLSPVRRAIAGGIVAAIGASGLLLVWPEMLRGSLAAAYGELGAAFILSTHELQPLRFGNLADLAHALINLGIAIPALLALGLTTLRGRQAVDDDWHAPAVVVTVPLLACIGATVFARRFGVDLAAPAVIAAAGFAPLVGEIAARASPLLRAPAMAAAILAALFTPFVVKVPDDFRIASCDGVAIGRWLGGMLPPARGEAARHLPVLLADDLNIGPAVAYFAGVRVVAAPYHQLAGAFADIRTAFGPDEAAARAMLVRRQAAYVLVCTDAIWLQAAWPNSGLRPRLLAGAPPDWLEAVPVPPGVAGDAFRLYAVRLTR